MFLTLARDVNPLSEDLQFYGKDAAPFGCTYGNWTVRWWNWYLSIPKSDNFVLNGSANLASLNQPPCDVWFLAGKKGDSNIQLPQLACQIPRGRSVLFPVINCEANFLECPELLSEQDLIEHVRNDENGIALKECSVNGKLIPSQRVQSDPLIFPIELVKDNIFGSREGITMASSDGYWVFLKNLQPDRYLIEFRGSCVNGTLCSGARYRIEVI